MSEQAFISEVDISNDGGIIKQILKEGDGPNPPKGGNVRVHYVGTLLDGSKFDSSRDRGSPFTFLLGKQQVIKGWDLGVASMKKGELVNLICRHDYAYGESGSPPTIPPKATLKFEVELLDWDEPEPDTIQEKIVAANKAKEEGNTLFNAGKFAEASSKYQKALNYFENAFGISDEERKEVDALKLPCFLNLAAAQIKIKEFSDAVLNCSKALDIDTQNVKALYRRGQAHLLSSNFDDAKQDLYEAVQLAPKNKEIRTELEKAKKAEQDYKQKQKAMFAGLFDKMSAKKGEDNNNNETKSEQ